MKRLIGFGSGNPVGLPDYKPLNPWGRRMPNRAQRRREALYQVFVALPDGTEQALGPKWSEEYAGNLAAEINAKRIKHEWKETGEAHVRRVKHGGEADNRSLGDIFRSMSNG